MPPWYLQQANSFLLILLYNFLIVLLFFHTSSLSLLIPVSFCPAGDRKQEAGNKVLCVCPALLPLVCVCARARFLSCVCVSEPRGWHGSPSLLHHFCKRWLTPGCWSASTSPPGLGSNTKRILGARSQNYSRGADLGFFQGSHTDALRTTGGCNVSDILGVDSLDDEFFRMAHKRINSAVFLIASAFPWRRYNLSEEEPLLWVRTDFKEATNPHTHLHLHWKVEVNTLWK